MIKTQLFPALEKNLSFICGNYSLESSNIASAKECYDSRRSKLRPHQIAARLLMDYGKNISLSDYGFLIFVSTRQELTPRDRERYKQLFLEHSAIATSLICGLPLPQGGQTDV
ncbi:hypothetical protein Syn7502_03663 (plasmid) [Synechococcus sp. PCC 7502]|uniref:hypothetical protein n=1 Tax=Synechococcus sp. PCC 7502 TaxID=1173263 RepID=UPI00029FBDB3|nr:hypothetical protein [Synechococcus sp. PCC 7502]AFY75485.1 hypothetical protein Syn7502_03663 [Synechococcus sp. PCC 7502]